MTKVRGLVVATLVASSTFFVAAPAQASCETELGDMCKAVEVVKSIACAGKAGGYLEPCHN